MNLKIYLGMLRRTEVTLAESFVEVAEGHGEEPDVYFLCLTLARQCLAHQEKLEAVVGRYGEDTSDNEPERLHRLASRRPAAGRWACCVTSRTSTSWPALWISRGPWSSRPPPPSATKSCSPWWRSAIRRPQRSSSGCRQG